MISTSETDAPHPDDRCGHLARGAFRVDKAGPGLKLAASLEFLDSALQVFEPSIDPIGDFEGYAVRRTLLALREAVLTLRDAFQTIPAAP